MEALWKREGRRSFRPSPRRSVVLAGEYSDAGADLEKPLADLLDDFHRRSVAILAEEIDHAAEQANNGEFDPERYRWLLRCLRELEKLPLTTAEERQPDGLATLERLAAEASKHAESGGY